MRSIGSLFDLEVVTVNLLQGWMIQMCSLGEELRVVNIRSRGSVTTVGQLLGNHVDIVERDFSFFTETETDDTLHSRVDCLIESHDNVVARFPLEPPLSGDDVIRVDFLASQNLDSKSFYSYPSLRPAESLVFWVEEACILEALNRIRVVNACSTKGLDAPIPMIFMVYYFNYSPTDIPPPTNVFRLSIAYYNMLQNSN